MELDVVELALVFGIARTEIEIPVIAQTVRQVSEDTDGFVPDADIVEEGRWSGRERPPQNLDLVRHELEEQSILGLAFHVVIACEVVLVDE